MVQDATGTEKTWIILGFLNHSKNSGCHLKNSRKLSKGCKQERPKISFAC